MLLLQKRMQTIKTRWEGELPSVLKKSEKLIILTQEEQKVDKKSILL